MRHRMRGDPLAAEPAREGRLVSEWTSPVEEYQRHQDILKSIESCCMRLPDPEVLQPMVSSLKTLLLVMRGVILTDDFEKNYKKIKALESRIYLFMQSYHHTKQIHELKSPSDLVDDLMEVSFELYKMRQSYGMALPARKLGAKFNKMKRGLNI